MLVIFFLISFKKQASCKFINFAQVFVNVGSEMAAIVSPFDFHSKKRKPALAFC